MEKVKNFPATHQRTAYVALIALQFLIASCNQPADDAKQMQARMDSLEKQIGRTYRPGLGDFMLGIQLHHAKLWFAGENQNWPLADFEVHEIGESLDDIKLYCKDRKEVNAIGMIDSPLDSVINAINKKDLPAFKNSFVLLTNTCNNCHKATDHGFNVVTMPTNLPVVNQDFKSSKPVSK